MNKTITFKLEEDWPEIATGNLDFIVSGVAQPDIEKNIFPLVQKLIRDNSVNVNTYYDKNRIMFTYSEGAYDDVIDVFKVLTDAGFYCPLPNMPDCMNSEEGDIFRCIEEVLVTKNSETSPSM